MTPEDRVVAAVQAFQRNHPAESFSQACERFLYYISYAANGMSNAGLQDYSSAAKAQAASGPLNPGTPPPGTVAWFDIGSPYGDGRYSLGGGLLVSPTDRAVKVLKNYGADVKQHTIASYEATGARYLGWTTRNGVNVMPPITSTAGSSSSAFEPWDDPVAVTARINAWRVALGFSGDVAQADRGTALRDLWAILVGYGYVPSPYEATSADQVWAVLVTDPASVVKPWVSPAALAARVNVWRVALGYTGDVAPQDAATAVVDLWGILYGKGWVPTVYGSTSAAQVWSAMMTDPQTVIAAHTPVTPPVPDPPADPPPSDPVPDDPVPDDSPSASAPSWFRSFLQSLVAWLTAWLR